MNINGHLIRQDMIIGISPLYFKDNPDATMRNLYRPVQLSFEVHTKYQSIEIKSDWLKIGIDKNHLSDDEKHARQFYKQFEDRYYEIKEEIAGLIGEKSEEQPLSNVSIPNTNDSDEE